MSYVDYKKLNSIAVGISIIIFLVIVWVQNIQIGVNFKTFSTIGTTGAILWVAWELFKAYLWKYRLFTGWLVYVPDLNGKWSGHISSNWIDPKTKKPIPTISVEATIKQTLTTLTIDMETEEMISKSVSADPCPDTHRGVCELSYIYESVPKATVRERSQIHYGAAQLNTNGRDRLRGNYWTDRETTGTISLKRK